MCRLNYRFCATAGAQQRSAGQQPVTAQRFPNSLWHNSLPLAAAAARGTRHKALKAAHPTRLRCCCCLLFMEHIKSGKRQNFQVINMKPNYLAKIVSQSAIIKNLLIASIICQQRGGVAADTIAPLGSQNAFNLIAMAVTKLASKKEKLPPLNKKYLCTSMPIDSLEREERRKR